MGGLCSGSCFPDGGGTATSSVDIYGLQSNPNVYLSAVSAQTLIFHLEEDERGKQKRYVGRLSFERLCRQLLQRHKPILHLSALQALSPQSLSAQCWANFSEYIAQTVLSVVELTLTKSSGSRHRGNIHRRSLNW